MLFSYIQSLKVIFSVILFSYIQSLKAVFSVIQLYTIIKGSV